MVLRDDEIAGALREENDGWADSNVVPTSVFCEILDKATGKKKGYSRRHHYLTIGDVARRLQKKLDVVVCPKCAWEKQRKPAEYAVTCAKCGAACECLIDEYLHVDDRQNKPCGPYWQIVAFAVTGGNEGHYYHVGTISQGDFEKPCVWTGWLTGKTFAGMEKANEMVSRIQKLLDL